MTNDPPTLVTLMEKPVRETSQADATVASNGEVDPEAPTASSEMLLVVGAEVPQSMDTSAKMDVPAEGAST